MQCDVFISYAFEDREVAKPIAQGLINLGYEVWYDELYMNLGDSLISTIDKGLKSSRFGIMIISELFLKKDWSKYELNCFIQQEQLFARECILPIWHNITPSMVEEYCPILSNRVVATTEISITTIMTLLVGHLASPINLDENKGRSDKMKLFERIATKQKYTLNIYNEWHSDKIRESRIFISAWIRSLSEKGIEMPSFLDLDHEPNIKHHILTLLKFYEQWSIFANEDILDNELLLKLLSSYLVWYDQVLIGPLIIANKNDLTVSSLLSVIRKRVFVDDMVKYKSFVFD